jgi:hypothetical protein
MSDNKSTGFHSTGNCSTGDCSTGDGSTGDFSTGNCSTGFHSTGDHSTGNCSTGDWSTGYRSTGNWSTGYRSTGFHSTGDHSTGNWSTGDWSTGNWSISNYSIGHFSTIDYSGFGAFNEPCTPEEWEAAEKPDFLYFSLTEWIDESEMSEEEKEAHPSHKTTGGYLKVYEYKEAFMKSWDNAPVEDREKLFKLPRFNPEVFKEISGIDVYAEKEETINIDGVEYTLSEIKQALKK